MGNLNFDEILAEWSKVYLIGDYADWKIEIDDNINKDHAAIALFLDNKTAKASGESTDYYEGFKKALFSINQGKSWEKFLLLKSYLSSDDLISN